MDADSPRRRLSDSRRRVEMRDPGIAGESGRRDVDSAFSVHRGDYSAEELDFLRAIDRYKRDNRRPHPSWSEILGVVKALGYVRPALSLGDG